MSASDPNSAIYVTDSGKEIKNKVLEILSFVIALLIYKKKMNFKVFQVIFFCIN